MVKVIGVRLHERGKAWYFDLDGLNLRNGDPVVVKTEQGSEFGVCATEPTLIPDDRPELIRGTALRLADEEDEEHYEENLRLEAEATRICQERILVHNLPMHLVEAQYLFDNRNIIFYFTADGRVDFRELVKDLASIFHTRIELRQIGVRDEARMMGGLGICGRELCCCSFLNNFQPVSIKMAKEQNLSMNPGKISGTCGRLLCCLNFEQAAYEDANRRLPSRGDHVQTSEGEGVIEGVNLLKETVLIRLIRDDESEPMTLPASEVTVIRERGRKTSSKESDDSTARPSGRSSGRSSARSSGRNKKEADQRAAGERKSSCKCQDCSCPQRQNPADAEIIYSASFDPEEENTDE